MKSVVLRFYTILGIRKIIKKKKKILVCVCMLLGTEPRALCLLDKHSPTEPKKPKPEKYLWTQV